MLISAFIERAFDCAERNRMVRRTIRWQKLLTNTAMNLRY